MEVSLTQHTLNIHFWRIEFHNNREDTLGGLRKSAPRSETDFAQLARKARMLKIGQHPSQVDSPRAAHLFASRPLRSGESVQHPHFVDEDSPWDQLRTPVMAVPHRPPRTPRGKTSPGNAHFVPASALKNKSTPLRRAHVLDEEDLIEFSSPESPSPQPSRSHSRGRRQARSGSRQPSAGCSHLADKDGMVSPGTPYVCAVYTLVRARKRAGFDTRRAVACSYGYVAGCGPDDFWVLVG